MQKAGGILAGKTRQMEAKISIPTSILIPEVVAICKGAVSAFTGEPIHVVAAGGIYNGKSLAAALMYLLDSRN